MKIISQLFLFLLFLNVFGCSDEKRILNVIDPQISISVNGVTNVAAEELSQVTNSNVFEIECSEITNTVDLIGDLDSSRFIISVRDTVEYKIISNQKDTLMALFIGVNPNINFTAKYIEEHSGKVMIDIPEVSELAIILIALHKDAERDKNMTDSSTEYYKRVKKYFQPYLNHPMVDTINKYIGGLRKVSETDTIFSNESYMYYVTLKMNACAYQFDDNNNIVNNGYIKEMAPGWNSFDPMKDVDLMSDFAKKSNFRAFYKQNKPYYKKLLSTYNTLNPISSMQKWLYSKFDFTYGNYSIYFSPLVSGAHSAQKFQKDNFNQSLMFIARAEYNEQYSDAMNVLQEGRVLFTEIDHNYVNPMSDKYLSEINNSFSDRKIWAEGAGTELYDSPYMIFNEYMTFAVYSLYANDNFHEKDIMEYLPKMENQMNERGFPKFKDFNRELLRIYKENKDVTMDVLFQHMLNWSSKIIA